MSCQRFPDGVQVTSLLVLGKFGSIRAFDCRLVGTHCRIFVSPSRTSHTSAAFNCFMTRLLIGSPNYFHALDHKIPWFHENTQLIARKNALNHLLLCFATNSMFPVESSL